jgi:predicted enzyme related to lactoylglutathione lyase
MADKTGMLYYVELPANSIEESTAFYRNVFGWQTRVRDDGSTAFDDTSGNVSGTWTTERKASEEPGFRLYISVTDAVAISASIEAAGGTIVQAADTSVVDIVAYFRDPAGNLLGIHQYNPANA